MRGGGLWGKGWMRGGDCGENDEGTVGKGIRTGDCRERDERTVGKLMRGGDWAERDAGTWLWGKG